MFALTVNLPMGGRGTALAVDEENNLDIKVLILLSWTQKIDVFMYEHGMLVFRRARPMCRAKFERQIIV